MARRGQDSYAWALQLETTEVYEHQLSEAAVEGLEFATALAENRRDRARDPRRHLRPPQLTVEELAAEHGLPAATVRARIALARRQLFGSLSDAAIAKRAQRQRGRLRRTCAHPGCSRLILPPAHGNRRYCDTHSAGEERTRRSRQRPRDAVD